MGIRQTINGFQLLYFLLAEVILTKHCQNVTISVK